MIKPSELKTRKRISKNNTGLSFCQLDSLKLERNGLLTLWHLVLFLQQSESEKNKQPKC